MAKLNAQPNAQPNAALPVAPSPAPSPMPSTTHHLRAVAWLRWRVLANSFRRKGGAGELIARIFVLPLFAAFALLPTAAAGFFAFTLARGGHLERIAWVLWGAFALTQTLNINLGQPGTTFDPIELIRFPLPLARWVLIRLCFGLLSPGNIVVSLISAAVVAGVTMASPRLFLPALLALFIFGLVNVLFTRTVFAWVDRWLSTRRAREVFTAFIFLLSLGVQALNARYNPGFQSHRRHHASPANAGVLLNFAHRAEPVARWLPPNLTADALRSAAHGNATGFLLRILLCAAFGFLFLCVYTLRMRIEFRGENLSDIANLTSPVGKQTRSQTSATHGPEPSVKSVPGTGSSTGNNTGSSTGIRNRLPPTLAPLLGKELLILRRHTGLFYGLVAPAVMVFLFAGRLSSRTDAHWVLLAAVAYALLGVAPLSYNSLGLEGPGAQFYFMAPVPLREVFFAKNVFGLLVALAETLLVTVILSYVGGRPSPLDCASVLLWAIGTLLLSMTVGNRRSLSAPRKGNPGRALNRAQSPLSTYISLGIMLGCAALGFGANLLSVFLGKLWIGPVLMLAFAAVATLVYERGLNGIETYALEHRDTLFEELGKKT